MHGFGNHHRGELKEGKSKECTHLNEQVDDLLLVSSAQRAEPRRAAYGQICGIRSLNEIFQAGSGSRSRRTATRRRPSLACSTFTAHHYVCAQLPVLHQLIHYELQRLVVHAVGNILRLSPARFHLEYRAFGLDLSTGPTIVRELVIKKNKQGMYSKV